MTNNSIYSRVTCDCAAGPWHKIDYEKPETLPENGNLVLVYRDINGTGPDVDFWDFNIRVSFCKGYWYSGTSWTHWAEIRLPEEGE